jgi:Tfp pilus assembly protein PilX
MKYIFYIRSNEKGSTLLISILILLLLTVIGIAATNTSTIEILISGNDKFAKKAFYAADGGIVYLETINLPRRHFTLLMEVSVMLFGQ